MWRQGARLLNRVARPTSRLYTFVMERVRILARLRPDACDDGKRIVCPNTTKLIIHDRKKQNTVPFEANFFRVLNSTSSQKDVYDSLAPAFEQCKSGRDVTVVAYGPKDAGKSFTLGTDGSNNGVLAQLLDRFAKDGQPVKWTCGWVDLDIGQIGDNMKFLAEYGDAHKSSHMKIDIDTPWKGNLTLLEYAADAEDDLATLLQSCSAPIYLVACIGSGSLDDTVQVLQTALDAKRTLGVESPRRSPKSPKTSTPKKSGNSELVQNSSFFPMMPKFSPAPPVCDTSLAGSSSSTPPVSSGAAANFSAMLNSSGSIRTSPRPKSAPSPLARKVQHSGLQQSALSPDLSGDISTLSVDPTPEKRAPIPAQVLFEESSEEFVEISEPGSSSSDHVGSSGRLAPVPSLTSDTDGHSKFPSFLDDPALREYVESLRPKLLPPRYFKV